MTRLSAWESQEMEHVCAQCGRPTSGTWSEGGAKWGLCEECFEKELYALEQVCDRDVVDEEE
jgi:hypothetical protein